MILRVLMGLSLESRRNRNKNLRGKIGKKEREGVWETGKG